jgi:hypothetical protein
MKNVTVDYELERGTRESAMASVMSLGHLPAGSQES